MAYSIGLQCTACAACVSICPTGAVQRGRRRYRIEPLLCTECLLYSDQPMCAEACPHGAILVNISIPPPAVAKASIHHSQGG